MLFYGLKKTPLSLKNIYILLRCSYLLNWDIKLTIPERRCSNIKTSKCHCCWWRLDGHENMPNYRLKSCSAWPGSVIQTHHHPFFVPTLPPYMRADKLLPYDLCSTKCSLQITDPGAALCYLTCMHLLVGLEPCESTSSSSLHVSHLLGSSDVSLRVQHQL